MSSVEDYNRVSMKKYGWSPWDFGLPFDAHSSAVIEAVKEFQHRYGLAADGMVGPITIRRVYSERELKSMESSQGRGFILVNGQPVSVPFKARMCGPNSEYDLTKFGDFTSRSSLPTQVVWHWDCCLSAKSCHRVLSKKGISSHGCIDNDGTFVQFLDLGSAAGWHAGHRKVNRASVGIDLTNAVYLKYQKWYRRNFGPRPVIEDASTNGRTHKPFLGYYPAQIETARQLALKLNEVLGIELATPESSSVLEDPEQFKGHIAHYHVTNRKWDVAGFPFRYVVGLENTCSLTTSLVENR